MTVIKRSLKLNTNSNIQIVDITAKISNSLDEINSDNPFSNGILNVFTKHSTSGITVNENEKGLLNDFEKLVNELVKENNEYRHDLIDNNAASHLRAFLIGSSETLPILDGKLDLGTWQSVFFVELDGPRRNRTVDLTFILE